MTLRPAVVRERLRKLREVVRNLESLQSIERADFTVSFRHYWLAERGLQLAAECLLDIGNHILAGQFNVHPSDYEDVVRKLAEHRVVSEELRQDLRGLGGFRNLLVHEYQDIDLDRVYDYLQTGLGSFKAFAEEIEAFLERSPDSD